jgi:hypothetical protein
VVNRFQLCDATDGDAAADLCVRAHVTDVNFSVVLPQVLAQRVKRCCVLARREAPKVAASQPAHFEFFRQLQQFAVSVRPHA